MNERWTIQLLGGLRIRQGERLVTRFRTHKTGALLAYLAYHRQQSHSREVLIEIFWPETTPESGRHNLSHALSSLRSLLEPPGVPAGAVIIADRFTVELNPGAFTTDVFEFENALRVAAQARNTPQYAPLLTLALEKCAAELLPGYYEDWIEPARERIRQRVQQATIQLNALRERIAPAETPTFAAFPLSVTPASLLPTGTVTVPLTDRESSARLPLQFTRFIGRETEIAQIVERLSSPETRLLTLTGVGGTGKTRLSLEAAGQFANSFAGSVWFVPLAHLSEASLIPTAILQAMGLSLSGSKEPLEQAVLVLQKQSTLLILDNFEQLVEGGAELVHALLSQVSSLRCLVTSRQVLGLPGEVEFAVSPLATPNGSDTPERLSLFESVRLFVDRAQASRPDFRITNGNAPAVAELCDRLEGIPLAIELAAARALVLSPSQMLSQLGNRFEFLVSRKRGLVERQRTLRAAIDWSYRLLTPDVQQFFCQLCVFRGGWSLEAAEEICNEPLALDMLAQLRECSLITTQESENGIRFRMLEMLREYAQSQLSAQELEPLQERHASFFVALAEEAKLHMTGPDQALWLDRLEAELDNVRVVFRGSCSEAGDLRAGLRIAAGYWHLWVVRGYVTEGRNWLNGLFDRDIRDQDAGIRAEVLHASGTMALYEANDSVGRAHLEESLAISRERGDAEKIASTQSRLATLAQHRSDYLTARVLLEECLTIYRGLGNKRGIAHTQFRLGGIVYKLGDNLTAKTLMIESFPVLREVGDQRILGSALLTLGTWALKQEDYPAAQEYLEESLKTFRAVGDQIGIAWALLNQGSTDLALKDLTSARERTLQSLAVLRKLSHPGNTTIVIEHLTLITFHLGELVRAARLWGAAERQREEMGWGDISSEFVHHAQAIAAAREALGDDNAFDRAWQEGRAMTREQAVAYALEETGETPL